MLRALSIAIALQLVAAGPLGAWGVRGHRIVNRAAVQAIPDDGPVFVKAHLDWIGERGRAPDTWRRSSEPFVKIDEDPNHGWFKEQFSFMSEIPRSRYEFVLKLYDEHLRIKDQEPERARLTNVRWTGTLPYAAVETYERITSAMRVYRRLEQEERNTRFIEMDIAFYVGWLGHYIGDGGMPLHVSIHHDGWQGDNPSGYTRDPRIHSRFESGFVDLIEANEDDFFDRLDPPRHLDDPFEEILRYLDVSFGRVESVYRVDQESAFSDAADPAARDLAFTCLAMASSMLRDLVYTAWTESARHYERPRSVEENPIHPDHPRYNPATGSAPAPKPSPQPPREPEA